jgi:thiol:disulfide interchange protein DsbD
LGLLCGAQAADTGAVRRDHVTVELVTLQKTALPGSTISAGLRLAHDPEWHTYWVNPGDSGLQTKLRWTLPEGVTASDVAWPAPHRIDLGPIVNFGYDGELILPVQLTLPSTLQSGTHIPLQLKASWLICKEECIPGDATLNTDLGIGPTSTIDTRWQALFDAAHQAQPMSTNWQAHWAERGDGIALTVDDGGVINDLKGVQVFPQSPTLIAHGDSKIERLASGALSIVTKKSDSFEMPTADIPVVIAEGHGSTRHIFQFGLAAAPVASSAASAGMVTSAAPQQSVAFAFVLALVGGILLNLMPCVLPVLSLKALALAEHSHDRAQARRHGVLYFAGTLTCFVALASALLALRAAGEALGWGFQLQVPWVVAALAMLMTVMGLSLSGVFELGSKWMGFGQSFTEGSNGRSAFFSGALAAVVASPCTAPFMGPALGFAITQPVPIALGVFAALATGLSLPVVALSFAPVLGRWLPRPGAWMERFKQVLAYPMYLTAIWLLWVLGRQLGADGMALALLAVVALVFGLWLWSSSTGKWLGKTAAAASLATAIFIVFSLPHAPAAEGDSSARSADASQVWRPWSAQALGDLRSQGKPVLVNMTAAWCITCLANERVALSSSEVHERLKSLGVQYLKGDWTHRDAEITAYLARFGRNGVPLYVVYPSGNGEPEILPQLLTPALVEAALERAASPNRAANSLP